MRLLEQLDQTEQRSQKMIDVAEHIEFAGRRRLQGHLVRLDRAILTRRFWLMTRAALTLLALPFLLLIALWPRLLALTPAENNPTELFDAWLRERETMRLIEALAPSTKEAASEASARSGEAESPAPRLQAGELTRLAERLAQEHKLQTPDKVVELSEVMTPAPPPQPYGGGAGQTSGSQRGEEGSAGGEGDNEPGEGKVVEVGCGATVQIACSNAWERGEPRDLVNATFLSVVMSVREGDCEGARALVERVAGANLRRSESSFGAQSWAEVASCYAARGGEEDLEISDELAERAVCAGGPGLGLYGYSQLFRNAYYRAEGRPGAQDLATSSTGVLVDEVAAKRAEDVASCMLTKISELRRNVRNHGTRAELAASPFLSEQFMRAAVLRWTAAVDFADPDTYEVPLDALSRAISLADSAESDAQATESSRQQARMTRLSARLNMLEILLVQRAAPSTFEPVFRSVLREPTLNEQERLITQGLHAMWMLRTGATAGALEELQRLRPLYANGFDYGGWDMSTIRRLLIWERSTGRDGYRTNNLVEDLTEVFDGPTSEARLRLFDRVILELKEGRYASSAP